MKPAQPNSSARTAWSASCLAVVLALGATAAQTQTAPQLLIRADDVGMCHDANLGVKKLIELGLPFSASVMTACPWYLEAARLLRDQPQVSIGIHLTLNSEWEHYKWGPVLGASEVPTLVDENGHFHTTGEDFAAAEIDLEEVRSELRAQIERAQRAGLEVDYLDYHMLTAVSTPELRTLVEQLAAEYGLGLATYFDERSATLWSVPPEDKLASLLAILDRVEPGRANLLVMHLGFENPEMSALVDVNNPADPFRVAQHRQAELEALVSPAFRRAIAARGIRLVNYRDLIEQQGLEAMGRPEGGPGYSWDDNQD